MQKLLTIIVYLFLLTFLESAAEITGVPAAGEAQIPAQPRYVALTFDDGPNRSTTTRLLDGLARRGASATFFLVGERIEGCRDLVERMKKEGHQVGNHTWGHVRLQGAALDTQLRQLRQADEKLKELLGPGEYWIRPPYGLVDSHLKEHLTVPMIHWSVDPRDWDSRSTDQVVQQVLSQVQPGDIVLLHDIYPASVEAALQIVDALSRQGYWFVTVEELLSLQGIEPQPGTMYRSGRKP